MTGNFEDPTYTSDTFRDLQSPILDPADLHRTDSIPTDFNLLDFDLTDPDFMNFDATDFDVTDINLTGSGSSDVTNANDTSSNIESILQLLCSSNTQSPNQADN